MFKFLHTADVHLDSPLLNLDNYDDAPRDDFRSATRRALDNIVDLAINEEVQFVLIAGDLYDGDCTDFNTPLHFRRKMRELGDHQIRVFIIQGNHDAASSMKKAFSLQLPDNVKLFRTDKPETVTIDELNVAIHGQGFATKAVTDDLSKNYPDAIPGFINIGMLHTSCGAHDRHDNYAPSTMKGLQSKDYQYWALGHIHKGQRLAGPSPWIIYPGNPQGRHIGETGKKTCVIATGDGNDIRIRDHAVDVLRWFRVRVEVGDCEDADAAVLTAQRGVNEQLAGADDLPIAVRIELEGTSKAHSEFVKQSDHWDERIRRAMLDNFDERVWVEKIKFKTRALVDRSDEMDSALGELIEGIRDPDLAESARCNLQIEFEKLRSDIPTDPRLPDDEIDLDNEAAVATIVRDAQELLIGRLMDLGGDQ